MRIWRGVTTVQYCQSDGQRGRVHGPPRGDDCQTYPVGTVNVAAPGYVKVDLQGVSKDGGDFRARVGLELEREHGLCARLRQRRSELLTGRAAVHRCT